MIRKGQVMIARLAFAVVAGVSAALLAVSVIHAQSAPEGEIAFVSNREGNEDIFLMDADGSNVRNLTNAEGDDSWPVWSPDGRFLAFTSDRDGNDEVYVLDVASGEAVNVSNHEGWDQNPSWSPDSERLLFNSVRDGRWQMYTVNRDGTDLQRLAELDGSTYASRWSPDGSPIAFTWTNGYSDPDTYNAAMLSVIDADGTNVRELVPMDAEFPRVEWSPDSRQIAYNAYNAEIPLDPSLDSTWSFIYNLDDETVTAIYVPDETSYRGEFSDVAGARWSPDGAWLSFLVGEYVGRVGFAAYVLDPNRQRARQLLPIGRGLTWSNDSRWIVLASDNSLYLANPRSGDTTLLMEDAYAPAWRPAVTERLLWEPHSSVL